MPHLWRRLLDPEIHELKSAELSTFDARLRLAKALNARCRHQEAATLLEQILAEDRSHGDVWFERIVAEGDGASEEDLKDLHQELEALRDEEPTMGVHSRNVGYVRILMQRPDDAERALLQAVKVDPGDARALELLGLICLRRDQPGEAKEHFAKALKVAPKDTRTLRLMGLACEQMGDGKEAEQFFVAALEVDPCYFWGWHSLGELLMRRGELDEGLRCIHRARSLQSREPASYFLLSELYSEQGHLELAQSEMHTLMLLSPSQPVLAEAYSIIGELRRDVGDTEGAVSYLSLATETDPDNPNPWAALGDLAREDQRYEDALRCYREALARDAQAADLQVQLGYVFMHLNQMAECEQSFLGALETDPSEYSAYLGLAECYRNLNRTEDELRMVKEAMMLAPDDPDVWNAHGVALEVGGNMQVATQAYEKALTLSPIHRKAANNLGFVLERRMAAGEGDLRDRAVEAWKRRLLICRDEGQSMRMAMEHLFNLGMDEEVIQHWLDHEESVV